MKLLLLGITLLLALNFGSAYVPEEVSILISVTLQRATPSIGLEWNYTPPADVTCSTECVFDLFRCADPFDPTPDCWGQAIYTVDVTQGPGTYSYTDTNVQIGQPYEYKVVFRNLIPYTEGYVVAGIDLPLIENRGHVILVVASDAATNMTEELDQLRMDMIGDGWEISNILVDITDTVPDVHNKIKEAHNNRDMSTIFLFGNVAVPYSGDLNPDALSYHKGAWPADAFYTTLNDSVWTDSIVNNVDATDPRNHNVPGDGKYDISYLNSNDYSYPIGDVRPITISHMELGRVNLNQFDGYDEMDLLRKYLKKNHGYRHREPEYTYAQKAVINDLWKNNAALQPEATAAAAWRTFAGLVGKDNIREANLFEALDTDTAVLSFSVGFGSYVSQYVDTPNIVVYFYYDWLNKTVKSPFQIQSGGMFPDWDVPNNYLRSVIAGSHALSVMTSSRPQAYFHHLNSGTHLGKSARLTTTHEQKYITGYYPTAVTHSLHGDPTLRMYVVDPPRDVVRDNSENSGVKLSWTASSDTVLGYHVYRSTASLDGPYTRVTENIVSETTFTDTSAVQGKNYYMVRAVQLTQTPATTFYNPSQAAFFETTFPSPSQSPSSPSNSPSKPQTPGTAALSLGSTLSVRLLLVVSSLIVTLAVL